MYAFVIIATSSLLFIALGSISLYYIVFHVLFSHCGKMENCHRCHAASYNEIYRLQFRFVAS